LTAAATAGNAKAFMPRLSAIIITRNEAANIAECLASVAFADERIIVDGGSTADTVEIARQSGARVIANDFAGFGPQKNFALAQAGGDWVLSTDADERVSPMLAAQIKQAVERGEADGYEMPRLSSFCGRVMRHSGWYPDYVLRLFRRSRARFSDDAVHERVICDGPVARLTEPLRHTPVRRLEDALSRMDRCSTAGAAMLIASGRRVTFMSGFLHGAWSFIRAYILRVGFLDGKEGFVLATLNARGRYHRYMKAWLEQRRRG